MLEYKITVPSKTFIAGEYIATYGLPALVFVSEPRFEFKFTIHSSETERKLLNSVFHVDSPAGKLWQENIHLLSHVEVNYYDPYNGSGGWGASTAQFLAVYCLTELLKTKNTIQRSLQSLDVRSLLDSYWKFSWNGKGLRPSGADLVAQLKGDICLVERNLGKITTLKWPFDNYEVIFFSTGNKVATHTHLEKSESLDLVNLEDTMEMILESLKDNNAMMFVEGINLYNDHLDDLNLVHPLTKQLIQNLMMNEKILAAKGCGALGADVVMLVVQTSHVDEITSELKKYHFIKKVSQPSRGADCEINTIATVMPSENMQ